MENFNRSGRIGGAEIRNFVQGGKRKKLKWLFFLALSFVLLNGYAIQVLAQGDIGWMWHNPLPQGNSLQSLWGSSANDVYAVGDGGTILHYDGSQWTIMSTGTKDIMYGVWGSAANDVYAVAVKAILHYDGTDWTRLSFDIPGYLYGIWGTSSTDIFAVGEVGTILHYDGTDWYLMESNTRKPLQSIWGSSETDIFAVGYEGTIIHYDGVSWSEMSSGTTQHLKSVWGTSSTNIYAVGDGGTIVHYDGIMWSSIQSGTTGYLNDIWGSSENDIYIATLNGSLLHYDGIAWSTLYTGVEEHLRSVWGSAPDDIFTVGYAGRIVHYDGSMWTEISSGISEQLYSVWTNPDSDIFVAGHAGVAMRYDGNTWEEMHFGGTGGVDIWGFSNNDVFVVGYNGKVYHYDGITWVAMNTGNTVYLESIWGSSGDDVFAVGNGGLILHYDGSTWSPIISGTENDLNAVWGSAPQDVYAVGQYGTILHYDGSGWTGIDVTTMSLDGIWGSAPNDVFAVGIAGTILHYDGSTWMEMDSGTIRRLRDVWGTSSSDVFVVGDWGTVLHYDGATWSEMDNYAGSTLYGVCGNSGTDFFIVGVWGNILQYGEIPLPNVAPTVTITAPADGATFSEDDGAITFEATATDPEDGDISANIQWASSLDGAFTSPAALSVGTHTITASVTDSGGLSGSDIITVTITAHVNVAPTVMITTPADGATFSEDDGAITFTGIATDPEDEDISSYIQWASSLDGAFISPAALSVGTHMITASVIDSGGLSGSDTITVTITEHVNQAPTVTITAPADGSSFSEDDGAITLTAFADDLEDGDISAAIFWTSSLDGSIVSPAILSVGTHTLTASVTDSGGLTGADIITVIITPHVNVAPTVTITAPGDGSTFSEDDGAITFEGTATDPEDGDISADIQWSSSIDGSFTSPVALSVGTHIITASVTDSGGLPGSDTITVTITAHVNVAPEVDITVPADNATFSENDGPISFSATATDLEDGDISGDIQWSSSLDGAFTSPVALSVGTHTITATATDSGGLSGTDSITVIVMPVMYVSEISVVRRSYWFYKYGEADIQIVDNNGSPVANAVVSGTWSGSASDSDTVTTGPDGWATATSDLIRRGKTFTFCVTDVVKDDWVYDSTMNVETCDSN